MRNRASVFVPLRRLSAYLYYCGLPAEAPIAITVGRSHEMHLRQMTAIRFNWLVILMVLTGVIANIVTLQRAESSSTTGTTPPAESDGRKMLEDIIRQYSSRLIQLTSFRKTDAVLG